MVSDTTERRHEAAGSGSESELARAGAAGPLNAARIRRVYRFMFRHVGNREEAEWLTERACLRATRAWVASSLAVAQRRDAQWVEALIRDNARQTIVEHLRRFFGPSWSEALAIQHDLDHAGPRAGPRTPGAARPDVPADRVASILAHVPDDRRDVLTYRLVRGASLAETAAALGVPADDARRLQWLALRDAARSATLCAVEVTQSEVARADDILKE